MKLLIFQASERHFCFSRARMEEFLRGALGKHSYDVYGPLESKRTDRQSDIANLDHPKISSEAYQKGSVAVVYQINLPSARAKCYL